MTEQRTRPLAVLVVEDEPANRALVRAILVRVGRASLGDVELLEAGSIAEARHVLGERHVDVALIDVRLPDGNGLALTAELVARTDEARPRVAIVSASVLPGDRTVALEVGADEFLAKPFTAAELVGLLERLSSLPAA